MRALLDVNVLIALLDEDHVHHTRAMDWIRANGGEGWASCPITQNGCIRVMSQPTYPNPLPAPAVIDRLAEAARHKSHRFWPDDVSLLDSRIADSQRIHGPKKVTDLYLLALAVKHRGRFATFDSGVPLDAISGADPRHLTVV